MMINLNSKMTPADILAVAVRSEIEAGKFYSSLHKKVKNEILKLKLKFLISEEKKHRQILERFFSRRFPDRKLVIPEKSFLSPTEISVDEKPSVLDLFKFALKSEKVAEKFYREAEEKAEEEEARRILGYLSRVERSHYFMIKSEIDMLNKFPDYYNVEDFHVGQDMFHVGP